MPSLKELRNRIASVKATGLTFAPEAGTQRTRDVVNKNITEDDIVSWYADEDDATFMPSEG